MFKLKNDDLFILVSVWPVLLIFLFICFCVFLLCVFTF